jgi:hypothetical protein
MLAPLKLLVVLGFVVLGLIAGRCRAGDERGRRRINWFIGYTVTVSFVVGLTQMEAWPFSTWPLVAGTVPALVTHPRILALDGEGKEHEIDYRAWAPLEFQELVAWQEANFLRLSRQSQDRVAAYLLALVERSRSEWAAGTPTRHFDRYLGPLSAPFFLGHPERWVPGSRVPPLPFVGLRLYKESWNVEERRRDSARVTRSLVYEYRS